MTVISYLSLNIKSKVSIDGSNELAFFKRWLNLESKDFLFHTAFHNFLSKFLFSKLLCLIRASSSALRFPHLTILTSYFALYISLLSLLVPFYITQCGPPLLCSLPVIFIAFNYFPLANNELSMCPQKEQYTWFLGHFQVTKSNTGHF